MKNGKRKNGMLLSLAALSMTGHLFAMEIDLSQYSKAEGEKTPVPEVINPSFEEGVRGWDLKGNCKAERGLGTLASGGLLMERTDPKEYYLSGQTLYLKPERKYNFSIMIRTEDVKRGDARGGTFAVEFFDENGKWISGSYPNGFYGTTDWTRLELNDLLVPKNQKYTRATLYLGPKCTGKVYYDEFTVTPADMRWSAYPLNAPMSVIAPGKTLRIAFHKDGKSIMDAAEPGKLAVCGDFNGHRICAPITEDRASLALPDGLEGSGELKLAVVDTAKKQILEEISVPLTVQNRPEPQGTASCRIDDQGYAIVNGKRFLPVGVYCNAQFTWELDKIRSIGFNTILPYNSLSMGFSQKKPGWERIGEAFDYCEKHDMKIIFALNTCYRNAGKWSITSLYGEPDSAAVASKAAQLFRSRSALLGYYICDELPELMVPELTERRQMLNRIDPEHPVWILAAIGYNAESMISYGAAADIVGTDYYPIRGEGSSLQKMDKGLQRTLEAGLPFWIAPQMFCWRRYPYGAPDPEICRFPTADEFRSMILLSAGYEARGYIFYDYKALCKTDPKLDGDTEENLKTMREGIGMLRKLEPFLLSGVPVKKLPVKNVKGEVRAWEFSDGNGRRRIAVVALGPEAAEAEITVEAPEELTSAYGKTERKDGTWIFRAEHIDSDLLCSGK